MLLLTRRIGETFTIDEDIQVVVLGTKGNQIRIGVKAPPDVSILRDDAKKNEK